MYFEGGGILEKQTNICEVNAFNLLFRLVPFFNDLCKSYLPKFDAKNIFSHFLGIFAHFRLQKGIIFFLILDSVTKLAIGCLNILFIYFK